MEAQKLKTEGLHYRILLISRDEELFTNLSFLFFFPFFFFFPCIGGNILRGFNELGRAFHSAKLLSVHDKRPSLPCKISCHWLTSRQSTWSLLNFPFLPLYTFPYFWRVWKEEMKACEDQNKIPYVTSYLAFQPHKWFIYSLSGSIWTEIHVQ